MRLHCTPATASNAPPVVKSRGLRTYDIDVGAPSVSQSPRVPAFRATPIDLDGPVKPKSNSVFAKPFSSSSRSSEVYAKPYCVQQMGPSEVFAEPYSRSPSSPEVFTKPYIPRKSEELAKPSNLSQPIPSSTSYSSPTLASKFPEPPICAKPYTSIYPEPSSRFAKPCSSSGTYSAKMCERPAPSVLESAHSYKPPTKAYISPFRETETPPTSSLSTHVSDESLARNASMLSVRNELPLIVKPLRKFAVQRRTTLVEPPTVEPPQISLDVCSSLPRNFHRPTVLHCAAPVVIGADAERSDPIPFIDEDLPQKPPPLLPPPLLPFSPSSSSYIPPTTSVQPSSLHRREDSGYRSMENIRKLSVPEPPITSTPVIATVTPFTSKESTSKKSESDDENQIEEPYDWGDEYLNSRVK